MFIVFNKQKIYSYIVALCTVILLFVAAAGLNSNITQNTLETSTSNVIFENNLLNQTKKARNNKKWNNWII